MEEMIKEILVAVKNIDKRLETVEKRLNVIAERLETVEKRLNVIEERLDTIEKIGKNQYPHIIPHRPTHECHLIIT